MEKPASSSPVQTVVALFDDQIDAEHALAALRKSTGPAASVSVLARDRRVQGERPDSAVDVTRAVMDTALTAVSGWLTGLAALMVPNQGHFLAAGPIGVVLSKIRPETVSAAQAAHEQGAALSEPIGSVGLAFERFGFRAEEAHYLEQRLAAGSSMIAVTASDPALIDATLKTFAEHDSVFIGQADTPSEVVAEAEQGLTNPMTAHSTEVIVADVVAPLRHACTDPTVGGNAPRLCGRDVVDSQGEHVGIVDDVLVDAVDDALIRYVVVGYGGVLGIARRRSAVPAELVATTQTPVRLTIDRRQFGELPNYDPDEPFSRKLEHAIHAVVGTKRYWDD